MGLTPSLFILFNFQNQTMKALNIHENVFSFNLLRIYLEYRLEIKRVEIRKKLLLSMNHPYS